MSGTSTAFEDWLGVYTARQDVAAGLDDCDWALLRSALTAEVHVDYSSWSGRPAATVPADTWVEQRTLLFPGLAASQHSLTNQRITVTGDVAEAQTYVVADHVLDPDGERWFTLGGRYTDRLMRTEEGWRISSMRLQVRWRRGDASVLDIARERARQLTAAERWTPRPR